MSLRWKHWALALLAALALEVALIWAIVGLAPEAPQPGEGGQAGPPTMATTHIRLGGAAATPVSAADMGNIATNSLRIPQNSTAIPETPTTVAQLPIQRPETPTESTDSPVKEPSKAELYHQSAPSAQLKSESVVGKTDEQPVSVPHGEPLPPQRHEPEPAKAPELVREVKELRKVSPAREEGALADDSAATPTEAPIAAPATVAGAAAQADQLADDRQQLAGQQDAYRAALVARLQAHRRYPRQAQRRGLEGQVDVQFELAASGQVRSRRVVQSSGFPVLDLAGLATIDRASPLPAVPAAFGAGPYVFTVPLRFDLR